MKYLINETRKLIALILIVMTITFRMGIWNNLLIIGMILLIEHLLVYGRFDFKDFLGHEWLGLILVLIPLIVFKSWTNVIIIIAAFLIGCRYKWTEKLSPGKYALNKIKFWSKIK